MPSRAVSSEPGKTQITTFICHPFCQRSWCRLVNVSLCLLQSLVDFKQIYNRALLAKREKGLANIRQYKWLASKSGRMHCKKI